MNIHDNSINIHDKIYLLKYQDNKCSPDYLVSFSSREYNILYRVISIKTIINNNKISYANNYKLINYS